MPELTDEELTEWKKEGSTFTQLNQMLLSTLTAKGVIQWWTAANHGFDDRPPIDVFSEGPEGRARVTERVQIIVSEGVE